MSNITFRLTAVTAAALIMVGCSTGNLFSSPRMVTGGTASSWASIAATNAPVRVAIYADRGAGDESLFKLARLCSTSPDFHTCMLDADAIRRHALDEVDMLLMTGLDARELAATLKDSGTREIREFVQRGGSFLGISAAATYALADQPLALVPYTNQPCCHCKAATSIETYYNKYANELAGFKPGTLMTRFDFGPVMIPATNGLVQPPTVKTTTVFNGNVHIANVDPNAPSMGKCASAVAGTFGEGRVWLTADHPELYASTAFVMRRMLTYLAHGREAKFNFPQRRQGQLVVGFLTLSTPTPADVDLALQLNADPDFDVMPLGTAALLAGDFTHVDALVLPQNAVRKLPENRHLAADFPKFVANGGTVVKFDNPSKAAELIAVLRALKRAPQPEPRRPLRPTAKELASKPVRAVFYGASGSGGNGILRVARLMAASTNYVVRFVEGKDIREGALNNADLYIAPGGDSRAQAQNLGKVGCTNLVNWIRNGGIYHGTCAGAYMVSQEHPESKYHDFLGLYPYHPQRCPYRGGNALVGIRYTPAGEKALGRQGREEMFYHGGPILLPGKPVADSEFEVLATFDSQNVYVYSTNTVPAMGGGAAIIAGRLGKGKVMGMSPHPEADDGTEDIVRDEFRYLTGREVDGDRNWRRRGNLSVAFYCNRYYNDGGELALDLLDLPGFDVSAQGTRGLNSGWFEHLDLIVVPHPREKTFAGFKEFLERGGQVYTWYTTDKEKSYIPANAENVRVFASAAECLKALKELSAAQLK